MSPGMKRPNESGGEIFFNFQGAEIKLLSIKPESGMYDRIPPFSGMGEKRGCIDNLFKIIIFPVCHAEEKNRGGHCMSAFEN